MHVIISVELFNDNMEIVTITYQDVIEGYVPEGDVYGLASYALAEPRRKAFLSNPNLTDTSKVMLKVLRNDSVIIGRSMMFPSRFKADGKIVETVGGSALEVAQEFRDGEAGGCLMAYNIRHKENNAVISSGFSPAAAKCHKALRAYMLCFPQLMQVRNFKPILRKAGIKKFFSDVIGVLANCVIWPFIQYSKHRSKMLYRNYTIEEVKKIPDWVEDISLNDGHRYMEVHDRKWFQWTLDNKFHSHPNNVTRFYCVSKDGDNLGFFMTKERHKHVDKTKGGDIVIGSICEWGSKNIKILSELDLHIMALSRFSAKVDAIFMATNNNDVVKHMKRHLFVPRNEAKIAFYDLRKEYRDARDINLWRVRLGYGDTVLN